MMRTGNIGGFKLTIVASAQYKGDERNPQLQRICGTAFKSEIGMELRRLAPRFVSVRGSRPRSLCWSGRE
jgi:threonyl-tRNA synthetase